MDGLALQDPSSEEEVNAFVEKVLEQMRFGSNMRGSAEYRKAIAGVLIKRAIAELNTQGEVSR